MLEFNAKFMANVNGKYLILGFHVKF